MKNEKLLQLNVITALVSQMLMLLSNFFTKQAVMQNLGTEYLGIQTVFGNFCDMMAMVFTATGMVMLFSLYTSLEQHNDKKSASLFQYYQKIYRILTASVALIGTALLVVVIACINSSLTLSVIIPNYFLYLAGILIYNRFLNNYYLLMADQKRYIDCLICGIGDIVFLIPEIGLLLLTGNYSVFLAMIAAKNAVECLLISLVVRRKYPYLRQKEAAPERAEQKLIKKNIWDMVVSKIGSLLLYNTDSILISSLVSTAVSGCYSGYYFISYGLQFTFTTVFETVMPRIGRNSLRGSRDSQFESYRRACMFNMVAVVLCICGFYFVAQDLLILWMGEDILLPESIIPLMCVNLYISMMRYSSAAYRQADGLFASISWVILFRGIFNVLLSIVLGLLYGLLGIVAATAISDGLTVFWYEPRMLLHSYGKRIGQEILYHLTTLPMLLGGFLLCRVAVSPIREITWLNFLLKAVIVSIVCLAWTGLMVGLHLALHRLSSRHKEAEEDQETVKEDACDRKTYEKTISYIIPVYNGQDCIEKAARSVLKMQDPDVELLIIDDGSTDHTAEICDRIASEDTRVQVFHIANGGQGAARNFGMEHANGRYIGFVDADDYVMAENLSQLIETALTGEYDVLCGNYVYYNGSTSTVAVTSVPSGEVLHNLIPGTIYQRIKNESVFGYCWNKLYRHSYLEAKGMRFSEEKGIFMEDALFNLHVFSGHPKYYYYKEPIYSYYIREGSASHARDDLMSKKAVSMLKHYEAKLREDGVFEENMDLYIPLAIRQLCWCIYNMAVWTEGDKKALLETCRTFSREECFKPVMAPFRDGYLRLIPSWAQRLLFEHCYHYLKEGNDRRFVIFYMHMYKIMKIYDRYIRQG